ncbi:MAG: uncharacterized protein A8A55_3056 [Amphiamblys sp. WSBS2006]|nr:MAG: uncharacterized protein A8A55_3056 [Amphiamblys sp. WSBS2006]
MFDLEYKSFAKHGDSFFLEETGGVLIVSEAVLESEHEDIQEKREFLFSQRQKALEEVKERVLDGIRQKELKRHKELEEKGIFGTEKRDLSAAEICMVCLGEPAGGVFLFPLCEEAHHYACLECLDKEVNRERHVDDRAECGKTLVCPILTSTCKANGDTFGMDEYMKASGLILSALLTQLQAPDSFLLTQNLPNEAVLLTSKTTVTLSNIEISVKLFLVLLEKTRITVGGSFSITGHNDNEDCIREHGMARNSPFCLERNVAVSPLALENIERMAPNSVGCSLRRFDLRDTGLINILPKLRIHEDSEVEWLCLTATRREYITEILKQEKPFCVGRVKKMWLGDYAVGVITKMSLEDCDIEWLGLTASEEAHVAEVVAQEKPFFVGRVKSMLFRDYAARVITKMKHTRNQCNGEIRFERTREIFFRNTRGER